MYTETLTSTAAHTHTAYTVGVRPLGFEVFCIRESGNLRSGRILASLSYSLTLVAR